MVKDRTNAERQRRFIARLKAKARATTKPQLNDASVALQAQITTLKAQIATLKAKRETSESGEIQRLKSANQKLRQERMDRTHWSRDYNERGRMPYHIYVMVMKVLRSDKELPTREQLDEAREAFRAWGKTATDLSRQ